LCVLLAGCAPRPQSAFTAADSNDARALGAYLDAGGDPNAKSPSGESLLYVATGPHGGKEVLLLLLQRGADPDLGGGSYTPLMNASSWCWFDGVTLLVEAGADVNLRNADGRTALQEVCAGGGEQEKKVIAYLKERISKTR
jgi:uncharacterized protein